LAQDVLQTPGGSLSLVSVTPGANGTATISGNQILYSPNAGYVGADSVSYTFTDNVGGTNSSTVLVTVGSVPPITLNEQLSLFQQQPAPIPLWLERMPRASSAWYNNQITV
jgi:hypothetical protein